MEDIVLEEGEEVIEKIKPSRKLILYFVVAGLIRGIQRRPIHHPDIEPSPLESILEYRYKPLLGPEVISAVVIFFMSFFIIMIFFLIMLALLEGRPLVLPSDVFPGSVIIVPLFLFGFVDAIFLPIPFLMYRQSMYYITNKRIVIRKGVIHSSTFSIPLGNVYPNYIWISNTFWERICGFHSIYFGNEQINPTTAILMERGSMINLPILYAVPEPERTKELIASLVKKK